VKKSIITVMALCALVATAEEKKPAAKPATTAPAAKPATPVPAPKPEVKDTDVVASAGEITVTKSEFEGIVKSLPEQYQQMAMGEGKRAFAENLLRMKLLAAQGAKNGLENDPDVKRQMALTRENLLAQAEFKRIDAATKVSDAEIQSYYDANKNQYEQVHARHILIAFKGSPAAQEGKKELTEAEAKAKAEELRAKIVSGAAKFEDVAKAESDDSGSKENGGDLGAFNRGQMVKEFEEAAFAAKPGEITPVVKTEFGYHIIKVEGHDLTGFAGVKPRIEKDLHQKKVQQQMEAINKSTAVNFNDAYFGPAANAAAAPAPNAAQPPVTETKKQ